MMNIVPELYIEAIVGTIPAIRLNDNVTRNASYGFGSRLELNRWLEVVKDDAYPLIWLLPFEESHIGNGQEVQSTITLIIATREAKKDLFNRQRYAKSFEYVLNPLTSYLIQGLDKSNLTALNGREWTITKFPNYSEGSDTDSANATIDLWDAVQLEISVSFNDNDITCLNTISYEQ